MTGMKQGAGDDPFASDSTAEPSNSESEETEAEGEQETESQPEPASEPTSDKSASDETTADEDSSEPREMPYVLVRNTVKDQRTNEHVYFLRDEYSKVEDELHTAVAEELGMPKKDVYLTDVREALVASADAKSIADVLLDWGYEYKQG